MKGGRSGGGGYQITKHTCKVTIKKGTRTHDSILIYTEWGEINPFTLNVGYYPLLYRMGGKYYTE